MKRYTQFLMLSVMFLTMVASSCKDDQEEIIAAQKATDEELIQEYLTKNNLTSQKTPSGLHHILVEEGIGSVQPNLNSEVEVTYKGTLLNGIVFDQSPHNETIKFGLRSVILGWQEGIRLMKPQGKSILIIPSHLGYADRTLPGIPANSVLIFDVGLVGFK